MALEDAALAVWHAARTDEGKEPDRSRIHRVQQKLADPSALLVVVERDGRVAGMALAEPFREGHGTGQPIPDRGHVSMVFVRPELQGRGVGREVMTRLIDDAPWSTLSVWTRDANTAAQKLYGAVGFKPTGETGRTPHGDPIQRWER